MDIFIPVRFRTQVQLSANAITSENIDDHVQEKIQKSLEGICSRFGYIRPGSIEIVKRSMGCLMKAHFNGHIRYDIVCKADVCNPVRGMVFKTIIKNKNELGILAEGSIVVNGSKLPVLDVLIPRRSAGITSEIDLETVNVGDEIFAEVLGKRYQLNDKKISVIARAVKDSKIKQRKSSEKEKQVIVEYDENGIRVKEEEDDILEGGMDDEIESDSERGSDHTEGESDKDEDEEDEESIGGISEEEGDDDDDVDGGAEEEIGGTIDENEY